jgi:hypothetical protein
MLSTAAVTPLSPAELADLRDLEALVEEGIAHFLTVGRALLEIGRRRLYLHTHETFAGYCAGRWGLGKSHAYRLIAAADAVDGLSPAGDLPLPACEAQARPLTLLEDPGQRRAVWAEAVESAGGGLPTAARVEEITRAALARMSPEQQAAVAGAAEAGLKGMALEASQRGRCDAEAGHRARAAWHTRQAIRHLEGLPAALAGPALPALRHALAGLERDDD